MSFNNPGPFYFNGRFLLTAPLNDIIIGTTPKNFFDIDNIKLSCQVGEINFRQGNTGVFDACLLTLTEISGFLQGIIRWKKFQNNFSEIFARKY